MLRRQQCSSAAGTFENDSDLLVDNPRNVDHDATF
jgi:hypothetical protein